jgi:hypothetical protein
MNPWPCKVVPDPGHPPPRGQSRVTSSGVRVAAGGSGSGFPRLGTASEKVCQMRHVGPAARGQSWSGPVFTTCPGRVEQTIRFGGGGLFSQVWIRPLPPPDSCVLEVGRRKFCVIRRMLNPPRHSGEAGFSAKTVRFYRITHTAFLDSMRFCWRRTKSLRDGQDRDPVRKQSASAARPTGSGLAPRCTAAPRRATLAHGGVGGGLRPVFHLGVARQSSQNAPFVHLFNLLLKQTPCLSRLRPPRLHPQGRRRLS